MDIIVRMRGGLGNQLFQYAYSLYLKEIYSIDNIYLDIREYNTYKIRSFELENWVLDDCVKLLPIDVKMQKYDNFRKIYCVYRYLYREITKKIPITPHFLLKRGLFFDVDCIPENIINQNIYLYGYYQNINYMENIVEQIKKTSLKSGFESEEFKGYMNMITNSIHSIAVSVRCGKDYSDSKLLICTKKYYEEALRMIKKQNSKVFVFTDDKEICKTYFDDLESIVFIPPFDPNRQLELMRHCDDFVISNSSFSWWGAFLGDDENKRVIMPSKWFPNTNKQYVLDHYFFKGCEFIENEITFI